MRVWLRVAYLLASFAAVAPSLFANACVAASGGNSGSAGTYTSCGGTTPQPGDTVTVTGVAFVINSSLSVVSFLESGAGASVTVDGLSPHTITCSTAAVDCIQVERGTFDTSAGSATNTLTVIAASLPSASYAAIAHRWIAPFVSVTMNLSYVVITNAGSGKGIVHEGDGGTDVTLVSHCNIGGVASGVFSSGLTVSVTNTWFHGITGSITLDVGGAGRVITDNTETDVVAAGYFLRTTGAMTGWTVLRNSQQNKTDGTIDREFVAGNGIANTGSVATSIRYNIGKAYNGNHFGIEGCEGISGAHCTIDHNALEGYQSAVAYGTYNDTLNNVGIGNSATSAGQGIYFSYGKSNVTSTYDAGFLDSNNSNIGALYIGGGANATNITVAHMSMSGALPDVGNSNGIQFGEGVGGDGLAVITGALSNSISSSWKNGIVSGSPDNVFVTSGTGSVGVWGTLSYASATAAYIAAGTNFGTSPAHANATYGDIASATNPRFYSTTRRLNTCDSLLGGPGTYDHLFAQLALRWNGSNPTVYSPENIWACMAAAGNVYAPSLWQSGSDAGSIGARQMKMFPLPGGAAMRTGR